MNKFHLQRTNFKFDENEDKQGMAILYVGVNVGMTKENKNNCHVKWTMYIPFCFVPNAIVYATHTMNVGIHTMCANNISACMSQFTCPVAFNIISKEGPLVRRLL